MRKDKGNTEGLMELIRSLPSGLKMAEIGSFAGESAGIFAQSGHFILIYCVDHWLNLPERDYLEAEHEFDKVAAKFPQILKRKLESGEASYLFPDHWFDFVYIDADHKYDSIKRDLALWEPKINRPGWIAGHDYYYHYPGVLQAVGERYGKPHHVFRDSSWIVKLE